MPGFKGTFGFGNLGDFGYRRGDANFSVGSTTLVPGDVVGTPVLSQAFEGENLSLTPATVFPPSPLTPSISTFTLYINAAPVAGYVNVRLDTLLGYVWQPADVWLDAYVDQTVTGPSVTGSPVTISSNTVNVEANSLILLIQTDLGASPSPYNINPETGANEFKFYADAGSTYDIDWGDGTIQKGVTGNQTRTYAAPGTYRIRTRNWSGATIRHVSPGAGDSDSIKILELQQWGTTAWTSAENMFQRCRRMVGVYSDSPNLTSLTNMSRMFNECLLFNGSPNNSMNSWDTSFVANMLGLFREAAVFNQDISGWNVSGVTSMVAMFQGAISFNQDISGWDVSGATNLGSLFRNATSFSQDLGSWVLNAGVNINNMFNNCGMSTENYSRTLIGWANEWSVTGDPINRILVSNGCTYHNTVYGGAPYDNAVSARAALVGATPTGAGWTISGDALV
jgi:surface protein